MENRQTGRVIFILATLAIAIFFIVPQPQKLFQRLPWSEKLNLKPGIDMVGGTSLLYQIKEPEGGYHGQSGHTLAESVMESRLRLLLILAGLRPPRTQGSLRDEYGLFLARPDLYYPDARLAIEYDGASHRESLAADNRRQNRLIDAGYRLLRFTAGDVLDAPAAVVSMVRRALVSPTLLERL